MLAVLFNLNLMRETVGFLTEANLSEASSNHGPLCQNLEQFRDDDPVLVSCLKNHYLEQPSDLPYNLSSPDVKNPSQYGQNKIVHSLLNWKRDGFFIECGALDGEYLSNTLLLERDYGWTGLLIEADAKNYEILTSKHRKAWTSHSCLSPTTTAQKFTLVGVDYDEQGRGGLALVINSVSTRNFAESSQKIRGPFEIQCFPLYTYLLALNRPVVDYLSLDVEGADFEIIKTIPFDKIIFNVLELEVVRVKEGKDAIRRFLEGHGYVFVKDIYPDFIFAHNSVDLTGVKIK